MSKAKIHQSAGVKVLSIEPCIIVIDRISINRAVSYEKEELGTRVNQDGSEDAEWHTKRHYRSRQETEEANRVYSRIRYRLGTICAKTDIGFVCPPSKASELNQIIQDSKSEVDEANARWEHCSIKFRIVCSELAPSNEDGVAVLKETIVEQTNELKKALENFDPKKAYDAIRASKTFSDMVADPAVKKSLQGVHTEAKELAKEISKALKEYGSIANAVATPQGRKLMNRAKAAWNVF